MKKILSVAVAICAIGPLAGLPSAAAQQAQPQPTVTVYENCTGGPAGSIIYMILARVTGLSPGEVVNVSGTDITSDPPRAFGSFSGTADPSGVALLGAFIGEAGRQYAFLVTVPSRSLSVARHVTVDCMDEPPVPTTKRMVGKGSVSDHGLKAAYAYTLPCDETRDTDARFEARTGGNILRLTSVESVVCRDDPAVPTPAAGFDTQRGTGTATLNGRPGYELNWKLVDGGPGGTDDFVRARLTGPSGAVLFRGSAAPPGKFPGSDQETGFNTAQLLP